MNNETETAFLYKVRTAFVDSTTGLDAMVLARLRRGRERAVAAAGQRRPFWPARPWAMPAGVVAILSVAVVSGILWWNPGSQPTPPFAVNNNEDMAIVLSNDNLDMYADMDFYRWLQAQQQNAPQDDSGANKNG